MGHIYELETRDRCFDKSNEFVLLCCSVLHTNSGTNMQFSNTKFEGENEDKHDRALYSRNLLFPSQQQRSDAVVLSSYQRYAACPA